MKKKILFFLLAISTSTVLIQAQDKHALTSTGDPVLQQLIKEHKNIHFEVEQTNRGYKVSFYEAKMLLHSQQQSASVQSNISNAVSNFHLTKDINAQTDANPSNTDFINGQPFVILNGVMYFSADDGIHGAELWRSDGTATGTYLVKDLEPGINSSTPSEIIVAANKLFFVSQNSFLLSYKLWVSDGTASGTSIIKDFGGNGPGVNGSYYLTNISGTVYFLAGGPYNTQVWKTSGTQVSTVEVKDLTNFGQSPTLSATASGLFYFTLFNNTTGRELWRSDGTDAGTFIVKDISDTLDYFYGPAQLTSFNNKLYFSDDDGHGRKLWSTDGTASGTQEINENSNLVLYNDFSFAFVNSPFAISGNALYMAASKPSTGTELFSYSTTTGYALIKDISPGAVGGYVYGITSTNKYVAFAYSDTLLKENQLWITTGAAGKTFVIKSYDNYAANFSNITTGDNQLYFTSNIAATGTELWKTNGTANSTVLVKDIFAGSTSSYPQYLTVFNNKLYFNAASKRSGTELWQTNGTSANTTQLVEINKSSTSYSGPNYFNKIAVGGNPGAGIGSTLLFSATTPETGYELYKSDGTSAGTQLDKDIIRGEEGSYPQVFTTQNNSVYFLTEGESESGIFGLNLFKADSIGNINLIPTKPGYIVSYAVADNGSVFYIVYNNVTGKPELWRSNGTQTGNLLLSDKVSPTAYPLIVKTVHNKAYFIATNDDTGTELWVSNGTVSGTRIVKDIAAGINSSNPYSLYAYNNNIVFGADDGSGVALWISNGTSAGTVKLKVLQPYNTQFTGLNYNNFFCTVNNILYFNATTPDNGAELWKTNGTSAGTILVQDIVSGAGNSNPSYLTNVNGQLFFCVVDQQLWKSDGTSNGTTLIQNLNSANFYAFTERCVAANKFFFNKDQYLWVSDGTDAGTHQVNNNGLSGVSLVTNMASVGNNVFFNGYTDKYNYELYVGDASKINNVNSFSSVQQSKKYSSFSAIVLENPIHSDLKLKITSDKNQALNIIVSDERGLVLTKQNIDVNKGTNLKNIQLLNLTTGVYMTKISDDTSNTISIKILK